MPGGSPKIYGKGAATICKAQNLKKELLKFQTPVLTIDECQEIQGQVQNVKRNKR